MHSTPPPLPVRPTQDTRKVRIGQKLLIYFVLINLILLVMGLIPRTQFSVEVTGLPIVILGLVGLVLGPFGILLLGDGLRYSTPVRILFVLLTIIPVANLILFFVLNMQATELLRAAGYKVGFFGAKSSRAQRRMRRRMMGRRLAG